MSESNKRPRTEGDAALPKIDEELLCLICTDLVAQTKQVNCCGALFCGPCIESWMKQQAGGNGRGCPHCRAVLKSSNIVSDVKSDRKSAAQLRRCPFHERYGCELVGTRDIVAEHKLCCPHDPDRCTSQRCKANCADQEKAIRALTRTVEDSKQAAQQEILYAAWATPEAVLEKACGLQEVRFVSIHASNRYRIAVRDHSYEPLSDLYIEIVHANFNVSLFCRRDANSGHWSFEQRNWRYPRLKVTLTLISPNLSVTPHYTKEVIMESSEKPAGFPTWLSPSLFQKHVKDNRYALGWTVSVLRERLNAHL